jgi:glycosyltransferase involved in cell wall biosynthesis
LGSPEITMIICTRDRSAQLENVLNSAVRLRTPDALDWELLIVDNGSTDTTAEVVRSYEDRLPIRLVREERAGLSNARNRGVAEAAGRYICWTDDDVLLDPEWLAAYWAAFKRHPDAAIFGGRIIPVLEAPTPAWFEKVRGDWPVKILLAKRDFGDEPRLLDFPTGVIPFGANYAIRTADQRKVAYEPGLGVSPNHRRVGEEAELIFRLMSHGATGWWVPTSKVCHIIPAQRQSWDYIYDYSQAYGETLAYLERTWPGAHHLAGARDLARVNHGRTHLTAGAVLYRASSSFRRRTGDPRRAAELLAVAGLYAGAARFARGQGSGLAGA